LLQLLPQKLPMMRASRIAFGLVCLAAASAVVAGFQAPLVSRLAPDFHLITLDGKPLSQSDFKGQVLTRNFWAARGGPCKR
jgi:hypothetical protein